MNTYLKKTIATVVAITSLIINFSKMDLNSANASASFDMGRIDRYQGTTDITFGYGAHAIAYADSSEIYVRTIAQDSSITATVQITSVNYNAYYGDFLTHAGVGSVSYHAYGVGIQYAKAYHSANGYSYYTVRYV